VTAGPRSPPCGPGAASRAAAALSCAAIALYSPQQLRMLHSEGAAILYTMQRRHHAAAAAAAPCSYTTRLSEPAAAADRLGIGFGWLQKVCFLLGLWLVEAAWTLGWIQI
jgi:hypothetical protein